MFFRRQNRRKIIACLGFSTLAFSILSSCQSIDSIDKNLISVMIESGEGFTTYDSILTQERGSDFTFKIMLDQDVFISSVSYPFYSTINENDFTLITLEKVMFPTVVTISTSKEYVIYDGNGGTFKNGQSFFEEGKNENHINFNTSSGFDNLHRDGYLLSGWLDRKNNLTSLGSRLNRKVKHLKAEWVKESPIKDFVFEKNKTGYKISKYIGNEKIIVTPSFYDGLQVNEIDSDAFVELEIEKLYLNPYIKVVNNNAFINSSIEELIFYDNLHKILDSSFNNSPVKQVRINATRKPRYSGTFYSSFSDKMDYLKQIKNKKKIVLFSGSSTRYGYDSPLLKTYFPDYEVINMGVYAYFSSKIQLDIIKEFLLPGDILINAPEFDAPEHQFFEDISFEHRIFNMFESDYDNLKYLDLTNYNNFFNSFHEYQIERDILPRLSYEETAFHLDDDGNYYEEEIYNINGDFILERKGEVESGLISQHRLAYTVGQISMNQYETYNKVYEEMTNKGIKFFFNYAPRNIDSLTRSSTLENRKKFEDEIRANIKAPFLSTMSDFLYPANHFYLIDNHLTSDGAKKRTILTAENLKNILG